MSDHRPKDSSYNSDFGDARWLPESKWEDVTWGLERVKVPGGWLYKHSHRSDSALTFVPDPAVGLKP
jgi:hypothetical protein